MTIFTILRRARLLRKLPITADEAVNAAAAKVGERRWARLQPVVVHEHWRSYTIETCADKIRWRTCFDVDSHTGKVIREWTWRRKSKPIIDFLYFPHDV